MPSLMTEALKKRKQPGGPEPMPEMPDPAGQDPEDSAVLKELGEIKAMLMALMAKQAPAQAPEPQPVQTQASAYPS